MRTCWRCHGDGEVAYNPSHNNDPQEERTGRCDVCCGTGEIEDGVTREELDHMEPSHLLEHQAISIGSLASRIESIRAAERQR